MPHRLLLADDSVTIQRVIELTFAEEGVDVVAVGDGQQAIDRLAAEPFDIVLADVGMPGKTGFEVAEFVKSRHALAHVPVVLLTGAFDAVDDAKVKAVGAAAVLVKPFEPQMVIARVRELLGHRAAAPAVPAAATVFEEKERAPEPAKPGASVDDYFDRLDRAFATLNPIIEPRDSTRPVRPAPAAASAPSAGDTTPAEAVAPPKGLADTFATLLAVEQGELPASALMPPARSGDDELVDRIARRVVEQLGDRAVRDLAADIVSRTAERLVREEIDRIKAGN
jgi:CheY-like chemotaxis protein